jgi:hypothetical protein
MAASDVGVAVEEGAALVWVEGEEAGVAVEDELEEAAAEEAGVGLAVEGNEEGVEEEDERAREE